MSANDTQVGGDHYKRLSPEPWDVIMAWERDYLVGSVIKYLSRWEQKGGVADLHKAAHFLQKRIELAEAVQVERRSSTVMADVPRT